MLIKISEITGQSFELVELRTQLYLQIGLRKNKENKNHQIDKENKTGN